MDFPLYVGRKKKRRKTEAKLNLLLPFTNGISKINSGWILFITQHDAYSEQAWAKSLIFSWNSFRHKKSKITFCLEPEPKRVGEKHFDFFSRFEELTKSSFCVEGKNAF